MPKKSKKKTKASKQEKQAARKKADELVGVGNGEMDRALAARRNKDLATALKHLALAQCAYQQACRGLYCALGLFVQLGRVCHPYVRTFIQGYGAPWKVKLHTCSQSNTLMRCHFQGFKWSIRDPFFGVHFSRCTACKSAESGHRKGRKNATKVSQGLRFKT